MLPAENFPESNDIMLKPKGTTEAECKDLPIFRGRDVDTNWPTITAKFDPTDEEREILADGGSVYITLYGTGMPPIALSAYNPIEQGLVK